MKIVGITSARLVMALVSVSLFAPGCGKKEEKSRSDEGGMAAAEKQPEISPEERAKRARAKEVNERMFLRTDAQKVFGVGINIAEVRIKNVAAALGVSPRQAMDLLLGKPILKADGEAVKAPAVPADKVVQTPTVEQLRAEMKRIKALPEAERLAAVALFGAGHKLAVGPVLKAVYGIEPGQKAEANPAVVAEMKIIQGMPEGKEKDIANLKLSEAGDLTPRQMIDVIDSLKQAK